MKEGKLDVTPTVMPEDAERALEYFGFSGCTVTVPESDPFYIGKMVAYRVHTESMAAAPGIVEWIKIKILKSDMSDAGMHLIVDDSSSVKMDRFGDQMDLVVQHYSPSDLKPGTLVTRLGGQSGTRYLNCEKMYRMLSGTRRRRLRCARRYWASSRRSGASTQSGRRRTFTSWTKASMATPTTCAATVTSCVSRSTTR